MNRNAATEPGVLTADAAVDEQRTAAQLPDRDAQSDGPASDSEITIIHVAICKDMAC